MTPFPQLPAEEKAKMVCELYGVKPRRIPDSPMFEGGDMWPDLTTDFLLELARERGARHSMSYLKGNYFVEVWNDANAMLFRFSANSESLTDALAMALIRFAGDKEAERGE